MAFYDREFGITVPSYGVEDYPYMDRAAEFEAAEHSGAWGLVDAPRFGDLAVFGLTRLHHGHVGVVVDPVRVMHVVENSCTRLDRLDGPGWAPTLRGFYRWQGA